MVQAALDALSIESAARAGKAKADEVRASEAVKTTFAKLRHSAKGNTVAEREDWARQQPEYQQAVETYAKAAGAHEYHRDRRVKAEAILSAWQTECSNERASRRMT
jgi:hypothetical protein